MEHPGRSIAWGRWAIVGDEEDGFGGQGRSDSGAGFEPAPDLDHSNEEVRESLKDWLRWLHTDIGFSGWRLDYVKVWLLGVPARYACCACCVLRGIRMLLDPFSVARRKPAARVASSLQRQQVPMNFRALQNTESKCTCCMNAYHTMTAWYIDSFFLGAPYNESWVHGR